MHFKGKGFYNTDYGTAKRKRELERPPSGADKGDGAKKGGDGAKTTSESSSGSGSSGGGSSSGGSSGGGSSGGGSGGTAD